MLPPARAASGDGVAPSTIYIIAQWARHGKGESEGGVHKSKRTVTLAIYQPMINVVLFHCNTRTAREGLALLADQGLEHRKAAGSRS